MCAKTMIFMIRTNSNCISTPTNMQKTNVKAAHTPARRTTIFSRTLVLALLAIASIGVKAADYVLTYTNGNTTYYLARNGTSGVQRVTTFDPATCIWSCSSNTAGTTAGTLNNSNTYGYLFQTVNGTRYFLAASASALALGTDASANNYFRWRTNGTYVYNRYSNNTSYYINLGSGVARNTTANTASNARPYQVTTTTTSSTTTNPTISGADLITTTGNTNYSASGAAYRIGYTNYNFNGTNHYFDVNGNSFTGTPSAATIGSYTWNLTSNSNATVNNSGVVNVSSLPEFDLILTLTASATATGGTPAAPANTKLSSTKEITIQGAKPSAPTISVSGTSVTITTNAAGNTSIRYTVDGSNPTASTGTVYNNTFDVGNSANSPVTIKAVTVRNGNASDVSTEVVTLTLPEPVITVDGDAGTATISATAGATIYYTTDGSTPTTSSAQYTSAISGLSMMTTIKAIAVKDGWNDSPVASELVTITSNVSGGTVTLFDYEDHTWTYYSGIDASVDGGNYNTNYAGKMYSPNPRNVKITYNGVNGIANSTTEVKVSTTEGETSFVYYKTLEESSTIGEYKYQVISNPFSVRPSTGSGNSKVYYGFAGWKIVSGGEYIKNHSNNDVLSLDEEIVFNNLLYPSVNCTSAEIVFETTWTQANVQTGSNITTMIGKFSGGTYETNFAVMTGGYTTAWTGNKNVTVTSVYPDGSSDTRSTNNNYTRLNVTVSSGYTVKYEYININNDNTTLSLGTGTKTLYIGRGVSNTTANGVVCNLIQGCNGTINSGGLSYTLKIESGIYNYLSYTRGYDGGAQTSTITGTVSMKSVLGCDYDRAKGDNSKLKIQQQIMLGYTNSGTQVLRSPAAGDEVLNVTLKSGSLNSSLNSASTADAKESFYIGIGGEYSPGARVFTMEGGELWNLAAGICKNTANTNSIRFRIKGGLVKGSIYGSAANANSYGYKQMIITGGTIKGWIAGGGNGTSANGGTTTGSSYIYVGGNARVDSEGSSTKINSSLGGQVFGSGSGVDGSTTWGEMLYGSNVVIADNAYIERNVFGGGNFGWTDEYANIYLTGEGMSVGKVFGGANQNKGDNVRIYMTGGTVREGLYGGSNTTGTISNNVKMVINGGQVGSSSAHANIHGGGYGSSTIVTGNVDITLGSTGQTTPGVTVYGDVYGGSALGSVNGTLANTTYHTNVTLNAGTINGSLYGGALGSNSVAANVYSPVTVTVNGGSVKKTDANGANGSGAVYGCNNINGAPQRAVAVIINGTDPAPSTNEYALFAVYGGGNQANYTYGTPTVTVNNCDNSIEYVYGGGNAAHITNGNTNVTINGGNKIGNVFGGGNGTVTAANVSGNTNVNIYGGTIGRVFGGSNSAGTIGGNLNVNIEKNSSCAIQVGSVYSGGNKADSKLGTITVGCMADGDMIDSLFCGANQANVTGNVNFTMTGGRIGNLFGGNNQSGNVSGSIAVTVNWTTGQNACSNNYLGNVFGGGNLATFGTPESPKAPTVSILNGIVSGNVYGGGKGNLVDGPNRGVAGKVTGNPTVIIGDNVNGHTATVVGDVYGGGDAADVVGVPEVTVNDCNSSVGNVYGGGNAADVNGATVTINGGDIGDVFGGGHGDKDATNPSKYADVKGNVTLNVYGGTIERVFAGSNSKGTITGTSALTVNKTGACEMKIGEVYGGGNEAAGKASTINIGCTGEWTTTGEHNHNNADTISNRIGYELEGIGYVYGGANQANIGTNESASDIEVTINSGIVANVFGGNNTSGTIYGKITVNIEKTSETGTCGWYVGNVFGGGNLASYSGSPAVNIKNGLVSLNVYGGGKGSSAVVTGNPLVTIGDNTNGHSAYVATVGGNVYGGGDAAAVSGNTRILFQKGNNSAAKLYGGGNAAGVSGTATVDMQAGTVTDGIYGGCDSIGTVQGAIAVNITGGTIGANGTPANVHGGGYGAGTDTEGNVTVNINGSGVNIWGDVYGGSGFGNVNDAVQDITTVHLQAGTVHGNVYGGGLGDANNAALVNGTVNVTIDGGTVTGYVFGCNNVNGTPKGVVTVTINGTDTPASGYALSEVYGGGNMAHYIPGDGITASPKVIVNGCDNSIGVIYGGGNAANVPSTDVTIWGGTIGKVFGGGHGNKNANPQTQADVNGDVAVKIYGGTIGEVFGGSNSKGTITGASTVTIQEHQNSTCAMSIKDVYGGGNQAEGNAGTLSIGCGAIITGNVYGGAKEADVNSDIHLIITGGTLHNVFGGNNIDGDISGSIIVDINQGDCDSWHVDTVYGGGNLADYTPDDDGLGNLYPQVNIIKGTVSGNVFGGGFGSTARVTANPRVNLIGGTVNGHIFGGGEAAPVTGNPLVTANNGSVTNIYGGGLGQSAIVTGNPAVNVNLTSGTLTVIDVFGGGDAAAVTGNTSVTLTAGSVQKLFGGGNAASVSGTTTVTLTAGSVSGGVYGGCNASGSVGAVTVALNGGTVGTNNTHADVYGGGYGANTTTTGNIGVTLNGTTVYGDIYGGSALGGVNASTSNTSTVTLTSATLHGSVFGGGKGDNSTTAISNGNTIVNINVANTNLTGIYGGANIRGNVKGATAVIINANVGAVGDSLNIFGGGYGSATNTEGNVTVTVGDLAGNVTPVIYGDIYGGSALGNVNNEATDVTTVNFYNGTLHGNLYGGGLGDASNAAKVNGKVVVNISSTSQDSVNCKIDLRKATIYGCNNTNGSPQTDVEVHVYKTAFNYSDYASGNNYTAASGADPYYAIDQVFGGGNQADYAPENGNANSTKKAKVYIHGCTNTIRRVFGGGNAAAAVGLQTIIDGGRFDYVFGGGNGETDPANIGLGGTDLQIHGGKIRTLFGGSNTSGTITGEMGVSIDNVGDCNQDMYIAEFFCGNNLAPINTNITATIGCGTTFGDVYGGCNLANISGNVELTIEGGTMNNVYGGSKGSDSQAANITGNVHLIITGGSIGNAYGGSNINGNITGSITVDVEKEANPCLWNIGNVYGASNLAPYTPTTAGSYPVVNIKNGTINGSVYGGGKGAPAIVTSNPVVTIGVDTNAVYTAIVIGNVYGGGDAAEVSGNTTVTYNDNNSNSYVAKLFGGGNAADVSGSTTVTLTNGKVTGGVYGGCNSTGSVGAVSVTLNGGTVGTNNTPADVYGGGYGSATTTTGNIGVTLNGTTVYGDIYGGSALGGVNASTSNTSTVTLTSATLHGSVFGGGKGDANTTAVSNGNATVIINANDNTNRYLTGIYGGANIRGNVKGAINVNINANVGAVGDSLDIFGGGYGAATGTEGNVTVTIGTLDASKNPTIYGDIYGGSALGNVNSDANDLTKVDFLNGTLHGKLYGGGLGDKASLGAGHNDVAAKVYGQVQVNIGADGQSTCVINLSDASIFGCNNTNGSPQDNVTVNIYCTGHDAKNVATYTENDATYAIKQVFGGGNQADYAPENGNANSTKKAKVVVYGCTNTIGRLFGGGNAAAAVGLQTIINGGRFNYVFGGGNGEDRAANIGLGGTDLQIHGGRINNLFGGSNTSGTITGPMLVDIDGEGGCGDMFIAEFFCGNNLADIESDITATIGCGTTFGDVYGGCNLADITGNVSLTIEGGNITRVFGGSKGRSATSDPNNPTPKAANIDGNVTLTITGGIIGSAFGGSNINGNITGSIEVNIEKDANPACGWSLGNVYGASNDATYTPSKPGSTLTVNVKNGTVSGNVYGGGKGATATVTSNPVVIVGDLTDGHSSYAAVVTGDVYGGGDAAGVTGNTSVTIQKANTTVGNAYGGGNAAAITGTTLLTMTDGAAGNLYGGGRAAGVSSTATVYMNGGAVSTGIYGGCNASGTISGAVAVYVNGGTVGTDATHTANVHGGGYGSSTLTSSNVTVIIGNEASTQPVIWGDVYGGSALGNVNTSTSDLTKVWLKKGTINGSLYGGGLGDAQNPALVNGAVQVVVDGGEVKTTSNTTRTTGAVFGCNNVNGTPKGAVEVIINSTVASTGSGENKVYALQGVYGGGNLAHFDPTTPGNYPTVTINGCGTSIKDVFGGGNAAAVPYTYVTINGGDINRVFAGGNGESGTPANVGYKSTAIENSYGAGTANVLITDGSIYQVFGGSNANGTIREGGNINVERGATDCGLHIDEIYGGGNLANGNAGTISIGCTGAQGEGIGDVYGGANQANVGNNILLNITGGSIDRVFGGNNTSGTISGTITVNVEWDNSNCYKYLGSVFGGGNLASYTGSPVVNINNGTVTNNVYGGGKGSSAVVTGNPVVTVGDLTNGHSSYVAVVTGDVYGGGDAAAVTGNTSVTIQKANTNVGSAYGGGNAAAISGTTLLTMTDGTAGNLYGGGNAAGVGSTATVNLNGGTVTTGIYGGCNSTGTITGAVAVNINGGTVGSSSAPANIHGGGYGAATGTSGNVEVIIGTAVGAQTYPTIYGDVYGGSALGKVNGTSVNTSLHTYVTMNAGTINGSLYGGALGNSTTAANVYAPVAVNVNGGSITGEVYGCNNVNGAPQSTVTVDINGTSTVQSGYALGKVFGGGNRAAYTGTPVVTVHNCDNSIEYVYGGGNAASVAGTDVTIYGGDEIGNVFGGCYGADVTTSGTLVKIYGGKIGKVFGGSNSSGTITGAISVTVNKATETGHSSCDIDIDEIYGGGNMAASSAGTLNIGCADHIGSVYGGSNDADITGDIVLNITSGYIDNVFGGNNTGHGISGSITVNIEDAENTCGMEIGNVYGGGNMAAYSNSGQNYPVVNIKKGSITGNVFGGGLGSTATVTANPQVVLTGGTIAGKVFGGGEAAPVVGNPTITASGAEATATRLYGGGLGSTAVVTGNTTVIVSNGEFGYVFGGGEAADQSGNVTVNILGGTITEDVYGGGALAHTNIGNISGNTITPAVYTTTVNLTGGTMKNVYGGGLGDADTEAKVYGNVLVKLNEGVADDQAGAAVTGYLFGCNNINGTPKGSATVHVFATQNSGLGSILTKNNSSYDMKAVYGGGNMAAYIPASDTASTHVIIDGCGKTSIEYVYGGGNAAPAPATNVTVYGTYNVNSIFGGGNGKDSITVNGVKEPNPGADVGIYKVTPAVYEATDAALRYYDPGHEKGDDKYILYGDTTGTIIGTTNVTFYGGIVSHLFGGSNTKGDIIKESKVILGDENLETCEFKIDDVYGGSNEAYMSGSSNIDMKCIDGMGEVYGGSRMADVNQDVVLTISGGHYNKVFGGNNISGRIFGSITVNIEQTGCLPIVIGELYGGGNQAPYSVFGYDGNTVLEQGTRLYHDPVINIISCDSIHKVFGGGLGATAKVVGNPTININMVKGWTNGDYRGGSDTQNEPHAAYINTKKVSDNIGVIDTVFGGGNEAIVVGETYVNVGTESTVTVRDVTKAVYDVISSQIDGIEDPGFAQGDGDAVTKDLTITVEGANITGNIYGGGNNANVTGGTHIQLGPRQ